VKKVPGTTLLPIQVALVSYSLCPAQDSWLPGLPAEASVVSFSKKQFAWCATGLESPAVASMVQLGHYFLCNKSTEDDTAGGDPSIAVRHVVSKTLRATKVI